MNQGEMILTPEEAALLLQMLEPRCEYDPATCYALFDRLEACAARVPPPLNGDKLWNGLTIDLVKTNTHQNQSLTVVRARSAAEAVRLLQQAGERISVNGLKTYWSQCASNEAACAATERGVWVRASEGWVKKERKLFEGVKK